MKGFEDFLNDLKNNEKLQKKVEEAQSPKDACDILKKEGYSVTEDEFTEFYLDNVSGGFLDSSKTDISQKVENYTVGDKNFVYIGQGQGNGTMSSIDPMAVLQLMFGKGLG